ncbi:N-acetylmuramic acid 6-phosphate etherase [Dyadobacter tibetensis]|uniref:N-acetylmuramic acid 6-phosphate etherase n=1 Tax=Dyadobacter tibetensis TaxID=1211851 RepID=UPI00046FFEE7|nr:N-acetylmuramic acid 6-phosphate etherase [Dyadobacter tibetensis]
MLTTESSSKYNDLEKMSVSDIIHSINQEDETVPGAVRRALPQIEALISQIEPRMKAGGRIFYIGAGTSGRLGILDASECPPTFGVSPGLVVGLIAGGDHAIRNAVENAEDDWNQAWIDLQAYKPTAQDTLIGIAASGRTPYVIGGLNEAQKAGMLTGCVVCNQGSAVAMAAQYPVEVVVGPEFLTGSTRMKSGTAQKLVLNMITTAAMIRLGKVKGNKMVDMQLTNEKLVGRAIGMIIDELDVSPDEAASLLDEHGSVRAAIEAVRK